MKHLKLLCLFGLFFILYSCNSDSPFLENQQNENQTSNSDPIASIRGGSDNCKNFIENGEFENIPDIDCLGDHFSANNPHMLNNGIGAFGLGCIHPWKCYSGSSDLMMPTFNWSDYLGLIFINSFWDNYVFDNNWAFNCVSLQGSTHHEGIHQSVALLPDPDILYKLELDYSSTSFEDHGNNGDLRLEIRFENGLTVGGNTGCDHTGNIEANFVHDIPFGLNYPEIIHVEENFKLPVSSSNLVIQAFSNLDLTGTQVQEGVFVDNVCLTCSSELVQGISTTEVNSCGFDFQPLIDPGLNVVSFEWDFGDGSAVQSTSSLAPIYHGYSSDGYYEVKLTVIDDRGCCTMVRKDIYCGGTPEICDFLLCWATAPPSQCAESMQGLDDAYGFTFIDQTGTLQTEYFSSPIHVHGGWSQMFNEWRNILSASPYFVPAQNIKDSHPLANCQRTNEVFVLEDVNIIMISFFGTVNNGFHWQDSAGNWNYTSLPPVSAEVFFHSPDCDFDFEGDGCN